MKYAYYVQVTHLSLFFLQQKWNLIGIEPSFMDKPTANIDLEGGGKLRPSVWDLFATEWRFDKGE